MIHNDSTGGEIASVIGRDMILSTAGAALSRLLGMVFGRLLSERGPVSFFAGGFMGQRY